MSDQGNKTRGLDETVTPKPKKTMGLHQAHERIFSACVRHRSDSCQLLRGEENCHHRLLASLELILVGCLSPPRVLCFFCWVDIEGMSGCQLYIPNRKARAVDNGNE